MSEACDPAISQIRPKLMKLVSSAVEKPPIAHWMRLTPRKIPKPIRKLQAKGCLALMERKMKKAMKKKKYHFL